MAGSNLSPQGRLCQKVVAISGIASGQGRAAAVLFAREGALVVGSDLNAKGARETAGMVDAEGGVCTVLAPLDASDRSHVEEWLSLAAEKHGGLDVVYNNAGNPRFGAFSHVSDEDYRLTMKELDIVWYGSQCAWPYLVAQGGGAILNTGSIAGFTGARYGHQAAHSAAKGAVIALSRQLAAEGADVGIRVNCISPGGVASPGAIKAVADGSPGAGFVQRSLGGQLGRPEEIAHAALYLASDEASWVTGSHLVVDGGGSAFI
jgi:meso-butanediol dehydrogenase / (S,S)-butanediol dehydrogenase / diacetyl reductase